VIGSLNHHPNRSGSAAHRIGEGRPKCSGTHFHRAGRGLWSWRLAKSPKACLLGTRAATPRECPASPPRVELSRLYNKHKICTSDIFGRAAPLHRVQPSGNVSYRGPAPPESPTGTAGRSRSPIHHERGRLAVGWHVELHRPQQTKSASPAVYADVAWLGVGKPAPQGGFGSATPTRPKPKRHSCANDPAGSARGCCGISATGVRLGGAHRMRRPDTPTSALSIGLRRVDHFWTVRRMGVILIRWGYRHSRPPGSGVDASGSGRSLWPRPPSW
jgi:hypothetical protein